MKLVTVYTIHGFIRGMHNVKAGLVSYMHNGITEYVSADCIVPTIFVKQAF
jgi:hypothetical protein